MDEYWWSARQTALDLAAQAGRRLSLPEQAPPSFARLRPLIHKGWEMVLMAAELSRDDALLPTAAADYQAGLDPALARWGWSRELLQQSLEAVRRQAIATDPATWLARHRFYPGIVERLRALAGEGADWAVLTTKGGAFAAQLLAAADLRPRALFGHEQGSKPEVLLRLQRGEWDLGGPIWFIEDRRPTLELVRATAGLEQVRCFLVSWGYLGPRDGEHLPAGIRWLEPARFAAPLAQWP